MERAKTSDGYDLVIYYVKSYQILHEKRPKCDSVYRTSAQLKLQYYSIGNLSMHKYGGIASICIDWISFNYWNGMYAIVRKFRFGFNKWKHGRQFSKLYIHFIWLLYLCACLCMHLYNALAWGANALTTTIEWDFCLHFYFKCLQCLFKKLHFNANAH